MQALTVEQVIRDALVEAKIYESANDTYDHNRMMFTAQRLSEAPFSLVEYVYNKGMQNV